MSEHCPTCSDDHLPNKCESCESLQSEVVELRAKLEQQAEMSFGTWLCPNCGKGAPSGKKCYKCLELELESFKKENEFIGEAVYKEAVSEGIHDELNDLRFKVKELTALIQMLTEALKVAKIIVDFTTPTPYPNHSCSNPDSNCDGNCVDVVNHSKIQETINQALSNPTLTPIIQRAEAERAVIEAAKAWNRCYEGNEKPLYEALDHLASLEGEA